MEIIEFKKYIENLKSYLKCKNCTVIVTSDKTYCLQGKYSQVDHDYCKKNNVEILQTQHFGGAIINFKEDLCVGNFQNVDNGFAKKLMESLVEYFKNKKLSCVLQDNDLLIDGFKCASYMTTYIDGTWYSALHISIGMDLDLIKNICLKPMVKIPKGLSDYGVTTNELLDFILNNLKNTNNLEAL